MCPTHPKILPLLAPSMMLLALACSSAPGDAPDGQGTSDATPSDATSSDATSSDVFALDSVAPNDAGSDAASSDGVDITGADADATLSDPDIAPSDDTSDEDTADTAQEPTPPWCGFRYGPDEPLLCRSFDRYGFKVGGKQQPPFPLFGSTLILTPEAPDTYQVAFANDGSFQDTPGTGTLQTSEALWDLKDRIIHDGVGAAGSFTLLGSGYEAFGVPVTRVSVSAEGAIAFGEVDAGITLPLDVSLQHKKLESLPAPYLVYYFTRLRPLDANGNSNGFTVDEFEDRLVVTLDTVPHFHNPNCPPDEPCGVSVQLRWFTDGHIEVHYRASDYWTSGTFAMGIGDTSHCPALPTDCVGNLPLE